MGKIHPNKFASMLREDAEKKNSPDEGMNPLGEDPIKADVYSGPGDNMGDIGLDDPDCDSKKILKTHTPTNIETIPEWKSK